MTVPAHTNTTTAAEVLRRQVLGAVAGKCISGASAEAATDAVMDVIAGLLADPTTRTEWGVRWNDTREDGRVSYLACDDRAEAEEMIRNDGEPWLPETNPTLVRRTVTRWTTVAGAPAADDEGGQER